MLNKTITVLSKTCYVICLIAAAVFFSGCGSSDGPFSSELATGDGYRVNLSGTQEQIYSGGRLQLFVTVRDPQGNPIPDEEKAVVFTSSLDGTTFEGAEEGVADIKGGVATVVVAWEDTSEDEARDAPSYMYVTASYRGAFATYKILAITDSY